MKFLDATRSPFYRTFLLVLQLIKHVLILSIVRQPILTSVGDLNNITRTKKVKDITYTLRSFELTKQVHHRQSTLTLDVFRKYGLTHQRSPDRLVARHTSTKNISVVIEEEDDEGK